ncbi:uncharacterized protein DNG_06630 [Cephalotrichum gorgonifer]|uniref:Uncharacterized protein n=1 Tax=Cephalotrichum gorgonifer TaxID=2041049 RepID=A0AAE8SXH2_9PEZI|nr:uncharacterized protein DNG_06630 [Cephalotrichum gorgonifer]
MLDYHGNLVAFEGPTEVVSTQLRLLPRSPQILILPSIQNYLPPAETSPSNSPEVFDAATFVCKVHNAVTTRTAAAASFLADATPDSKRLVFVHGGTPSAYALCIDAFARHETRGDSGRAESLLRHLIASGLAGLSSSAQNKERPHHRRNQQALVLDECALFQAQFQDPITRAMRAADALDEQTAELQPNTDLDMTAPARQRPRSMSLPVYGYVDHFGDSAPFYLFGAGAEEKEEEKIDEEGAQDRSFFFQSPRVDASCFYDDRDEVETLELSRTPPLTPLSPSHMSEGYVRQSICSSTGRDDRRLSILSIDDVVFGEASIVRMSRELPKRSLKRTRSLDRTSSRNHDLPLRIPSSRRPELDPEAPESPTMIPQVDAAHERAIPLPPVLTRYSYFGSPKTVFVKPVRPAATRREPAQEPPVQQSYADRGTDEEGDLLAEGDVPAEGDALAEEEGFRAALPFDEDMVVYLRDELSDPLLESLIQSFRDGEYPPPLPPSRTSESQDASAPGISGASTPNQSLPPRLELDFSSAAAKPDETAARKIDLDGEYDPFAYDKQPSWIVPPKVTAPRTPPTPAHTPPPPIALQTRSKKVFDFNTGECHTPVAIQNGLRSMLEEHFPSEQNSGFHQFSFHRLPELGGLWKPIFREDDGGGSVRVGDNTSRGRTVDQIIAIGSQSDVNKEFVSGVSGRLEKLGADAPGASLSGRLEFRYLIANAMQSFTAQPLAKQTRENPFASPYLLATLVIPHLETYLAAHPGVRLLLLEYPAEHLPTVLAIQRLVGVDLMKVAQVVDPDSSASPLPFTHIRGSPIRSGYISPSPPPLGFPAPPSGLGSVPVTQANFLLVSTATEAEVADFVSAVSGVLAGISPAYSQRPPSSESWTSQGRSCHSGSRSHSSPNMSPPPSRRKIHRDPPSPAHSDRSRLTGETRGVTPPPASYYIIPSKKEGLSPAGSPWRENVPSPEASHLVMPSLSSEAKSETSVLDFDIEEGEMSDLDMELDMEEKRLMPIFMRTGESPIGSQKALKFLGLA